VLNAVRVQLAGAADVVENSVAVHPVPVQEPGSRKRMI